MGVCSNLPSAPPTGIYGKDLPGSLYLAFISSHWNLQWDANWLQWKLVKAIRFLLSLSPLLIKNKTTLGKVSLCHGKKIKVFVKTLCTGTRMFPLRKNGTEMIKDKKIECCISMVSACPAWLQSHLLAANKNFILAESVCVCIYLAMHFEVFQFPAFSHFRKITQKRNCVFCFVLNPNSPVTRQDFKQSLHYAPRTTYHCMRN